MSKIKSKIVKPTKKTKMRGRPSKKTTTANVSQQYLDVNEVAALLRMSVSHVYTLSSKNKIPHIKLLGKKLLFDKDEITTWIKSKSVATV